MKRVPRVRLRRSTLWFLVALAALGATFASVAVADGGVNISGADASDTVDCRNTTSSHGNQVNVCDATATGGSVNLTNVDIFFSADTTVRADGGAVDVVQAVGGNATAAAVCKNTGGTVTINFCKARADGGNVKFKNVQILVHMDDGSVKSLRRNLMSLASSRAQHVTAVCAKRTSELSTCNGSAAGASLVITDVNVEEADGTTRTHVNITLSGGDATATVLCGNDATSGTQVQINKCTATATGGDVTLQDVRLHVFETG